MKSTAIANSNIAIIKYWGKKDYELNIPFNNSISFTMDDLLQTVTTVEFDESLKRDELILDGKLANQKETDRVQRFLDVVRKIAKIRTSARIVSKNTFPKSAGLASSASGFAALAGAASKAAGLDMNLREVSALARIGSGSACRSIFGGAVEWQCGKKKDGSDSYAFELSSPENWAKLRNVIAIVSEEEKKISSMEGMKRLPTSSLFQARLKSLEKRLESVRNGIKNRSFSEMAVPIMQESNNMHAIMFDSWPPVRYITDSSFKIMEQVNEFNESKEKIVAAYTFDAGSNAHIYTTAEYAKEVARILRDICGIHNILTCTVGKGIRFENNHLF